MQKRLTWEAIEELYDQQWVELVEYEWEDGSPHPASGVVGVHAAEKEEFDRALRECRSSRSDDFAVVYVGRPPGGPDEVSLNLFTLNECE